MQQGDVFVGGHFADGADVRRKDGLDSWWRAPKTAGRLAAGYGGDDLFVIGWREELGL